MKKVTLNLTELKKELSREEMKKIMGGDNGTGSGCSTGCGCTTWPAVRGCFCTNEHWYGDTQGDRC